MVTKLATYSIGILTVLISLPVYGQIDSVLTDSSSTTAIVPELASLLAASEQKSSFKDDPVKFFDMAVFSTQNLHSLINGGRCTNGSHAL